MIDICFAAALMAHYHSLTREEHQLNLRQVLSYLNKRGISRLVFVPNKTNYRETDFLDMDWSEFYQGCKETTPTNAPNKIENIVKTNIFVDVIHIDNMVTRRSNSGVLIFIWKRDGQLSFKEAEYDIPK